MFFNIETRQYEERPNSNDVDTLEIVYVFDEPITLNTASEKMGIIAKQ